MTATVGSRQARRYGFLGPVTTFTHAAMLKALDRSGEDDAETIPYPDVGRALHDVRTGQLDGAVVPIENSVEGGVSATLDALGQSDGLTIVDEILVPITFVLAARTPMDLSEIEQVATHSHAQAQCIGWITEHAPAARFIAALSTAQAAKDLAEAPEEETIGKAALCSPLAAEQFDLTVLAMGVGDNPDAVTRFVLVRGDDAVPTRTGADKTSVVVHLPHNRSGALMDMLEQFTSRGVNLSRIESRPIGDALGRYSFSIDAEGHIEDERVAAALRGLHRTCPRVVFLGSYPRADRQRSTVRTGTADDDFRAADVWITDLLERVRAD